MRLFTPRSARQAPKRRAFEAKGSPSAYGLGAKTLDCTVTMQPSGSAPNSLRSFPTIPEGQPNTLRSIKLEAQARGTGEPWVSRRRQASASKMVESIGRLKRRAWYPCNVQVKPAIWQTCYPPTTAADGSARPDPRLRQACLRGRFLWPHKLTASQRRQMLSVCSVVPPPQRGTEKLCHVCIEPRTP